MLEAMAFANADNYSEFRTLMRQVDGKDIGHKSWIIAALAGWGIALFEYLQQVTGNRIGCSVLTVAQLKILQEALTLTVFVPFALFYLKTGLSVGGTLHIRRRLLHFRSELAGT